MEIWRSSWAVLRKGPGEVSVELRPGWPSSEDLSGGRWAANGGNWSEAPWQGSVCTQQDRAEKGCGRGGPHHVGYGSSTHSTFVLQRRSDNVWRHIRLSQLGSAIGIWWVEAREAAKYFWTQRTAPLNTELLGSNVSSAGAEKPTIGFRRSP